MNDAQTTLGFVFDPGLEEQLSALEQSQKKKKIILSEMEQINELESGRQFNEEESNTVLH